MSGGIHDILAGLNSEKDLFAGLSPIGPELHRDAVEALRGRLSAYSERHGLSFAAAFWEWVAVGLRRRDVGSLTVDRVDDLNRKAEARREREVQAKVRHREHVRQLALDDTWRDALYLALRPGARGSFSRGEGCFVDQIIDHPQDFNAAAKAGASRRGLTVDLSDQGLKAFIVEPRDGRLEQVNQDLGVGVQSGFDAGRIGHGCSLRGRAAQCGVSPAIGGGA